MKIKEYPIPEKNASGQFFYKKLPGETRISSIKDFVDEKGKVKPDIPFLVLGYYWSVYQCYRTFDECKLQNLLPFFNANRVFIFV